MKKLCDPPPERPAPARTAGTVPHHTKMTAHLETADPLLSRILGRSTPLFAEDMGARDRDMKEAIGIRRLMIAGTGGVG